MRSPKEIRELSNQICRLSNSLKDTQRNHANSLSLIDGDSTRSGEWKASEKAKLRSSATAEALWTQIKNLDVMLGEEREAWKNLGAVLRHEAFPNGMDQAGANVLSVLMAEAQALEQQPSALQAAILDAATSREWPRLYALTLGRLDSNGSPLPAWQDKIQGIPFDHLDFGSIEGVMRAFHDARVAYLSADISVSEINGQVPNYTHQMLLARAQEDFNKAIWERAQRLKLRPSEAASRLAFQPDAPTGSRFIHVDGPSHLFAIFDNFTGTTRFVDPASGPQTLAAMNTTGIKE